MNSMLDWIHAHVARWHDTWEVVAAVGTAVAVIVALVEVIVQSRARTKAEARERLVAEEHAAAREAAQAERERTAAARAESERRAQALHVVGWIESTTKVLATPVSGRNMYIPAYEITVTNGSKAPIFDVHAFVHDGTTNELHEQKRIPVLASDATRTSWVKGPAPVDTEAGDNATVVAVIRFRDLQGNWWRRHENGQLQEIDEHGNPLGPLSPSPTSQVATN